MLLLRADSAEQSLIFKECGVGASLCELRSRSEPIVFQDDHPEIHVEDITISVNPGEGKLVVTLH